MSSSGSVPLAIVIPAYKTRYLRDSLQSIANQTNRNFRLYIGDDCSPEPIEKIVREFSDKLKIEYHRFDKNFGSVSLAKQWKRCLHLSTEPWVWCFGDDDFMEPECVAAFFEALKNTEGSHDVYRFNTVWINGENEIISERPPHPLDETGGDFLQARLQGNRNCTLQELIFSRQAWETAGEIPDFPLGWAADDALVAQLGTRRPIHAISGPRVRWRLSEVNISNSGSRDVVKKKIRASAQFVHWAVHYFENGPKSLNAEIRRSTEQWFKSYVASADKFLDWGTGLEIERLATNAWGQSSGSGLSWTFKQNCRVAARKLKRKLAA
jgi:glycosyltransferase involved in cell wall biosynthesis